MSERRPGLNKEVAQIFAGIDIPEMKQPQQPPKPPIQQVWEADEKTDTPADTAKKTPPAAQPQPQMQSPPEEQPASNQQSNEQPMAEPEHSAPAKPSRIQKAMQPLKEKAAMYMASTTPKQKVMTAMLPVLFVVFIFAMARLFDFGPKKAEAKSSGPSKKFADNDKELTWEIPEPYPAQLRDPMKRVVSFAGGIGESTMTEKPIITAIVYSKNKSCAMIGGQIVREGEEINGVKVIKIYRTEVEFESNGKKWKQRVQP